MAKVGDFQHGSRALGFRGQGLAYGLTFSQRVYMWLQIVRSLPAWVLGVILGLQRVRDWGCGQFLQVPAINADTGLLTSLHTALRRASLRGVPSPSTP